MDKNLKHLFLDIKVNEKHLYILLNVVKNNGDIKRLTREGLNFREIAELSNQAIKDNLITYKESSVCISQLGLETIERLGERFKILDKDKWIDKEKKSRIPKLSKDFIFLPSQNDINF